MLLDDVNELAPLIAISSQQDRKIEKKKKKQTLFFPAAARPRIKFCRAQLNLRLDRSLFPPRRLEPQPPEQLKVQCRCKVRGAWKPAENVTYYCH